MSACPPPLPASGGMGEVNETLLYEFLRDSPGRPPTNSFMLHRRFLKYNDNNVTTDNNVATDNNATHNWCGFGTKEAFNDFNNGMAGHGRMSNPPDCIFK